MNVDYFVINLKKDIDKKLITTKVLDKCNVKPVFIQAVLGANLPEKKYLLHSEASKSTIGRSLCRGEIGCAKSHLLVYQQIIERNLDYGVIFEDDIDTDLNESLNDIIQSVIECEFDIILLGHHPRYSRNHPAHSNIITQSKLGKKNISIGFFSEQPVGGYAYVISNECARKRIKEFDLISKPIDLWDTKNHKVGGVFPPIFNVNFELESNLDKERDFSSTTKVKLNKWMFVKRIVRNLLVISKLYLPFELSKSWVKSFIIVKRP